MNLSYVDVNKAFDVKIGRLQKYNNVFAVSTCFVAVSHTAHGKQLII